MLLLMDQILHHIGWWRLATVQTTGTNCLTSGFRRATGQVLRLCTSVLQYGNSPVVFGETIPNLLFLVANHVNNPPAQGKARSWWNQPSNSHFFSGESASFAPCTVHGQPNSYPGAFQRPARFGSAAVELILSTPAVVPPPC